MILRSPRPEFLHSPSWPGGSVGGGRAFVGSNNITSNTGSSNTKGNYAELVASAPFDVDVLMVRFCGTSTNSKDWLVDLAVGAAASEQIIVPNIQTYVGAGFTPAGAQGLIPIPIKAGTRIAARGQTHALTSNTLRLQVMGFASDFFKSLRCGRATAYGVNTSDSGGTTIDPGGTINTKGAWAELSAAITNPMKCCLLCIGSRVNGTMTDANAFVDIGVGAGGSEQIILPDFELHASNNWDEFFPPLTFLPLAVKAGQRLAVRAQCSINDATDRLFDAAIIGFD